MGDHETQQARNFVIRHCFGLICYKNPRVRALNPFPYHSVNKPNSVVRTYCIFLGEQMLLVVLANNSVLF